MTEMLTPDRAAPIGGGIADSKRFSGSKRGGNMNMIKQRHTEAWAGRGRGWARVGGCLVALVLLTAACGDGGGETGATENSAGTLVPDSIGETKIADEPDKAQGKTAPCRSLTADRVGALVGRPVTESRQLADLYQQPFNQMQMSMHEVCIFVETSAPTQPGVMVISSDEPRAYDLFTSQIKGSKGDQPVTAVPAIGDRAVGNQQGIIAFSKGARSTSIVVLLGHPSVQARSGGALNSEALIASVNATALELAKQLAKS